MNDKILKYPIGCKIKWCNEEYEVIENYDDYSGTVKQGEDIFRSFYFSYQGEVAEVVNIE